jgi:hypothetical protein
MLTLLINETKPLAGLFASTTGGIGSVPDISVADEGQAVSVQTFTRTAGVITDSFVAGDVLHIGIGDGVNAPVCYIELSSASPATGTMAINTVGMVALFAATSANQLTLNVGVVRARAGYTNTIFSAPIVIHRSVIDPDTAVPTPSILGAGVAAALQVAINTALGFVRLDASARLPAVDGSQLTNLPNTGGVTSITGTENEITVTGTTTPTLSLPAALTFTGKTVTGGTFTGGAFNGTLGATTPSTIAGTTGVFSGTLNTSGASAWIYTTGSTGYIYTTGANAQIYTEGAGAHIRTQASGAYIQSRSTFNLFDGTFTTTLSHAPSADRAIAFPNAAGTLALTSDITGGTLAGSFTTLTVNDNSTLGSNNSDTVNFNARVASDINPATDNTYDLGVTGHEWRNLNIDGTANIDSLVADTADIDGGTIDGTAIGATTPSTIAGTTGTFSGAVQTTGSEAVISTSGVNALISTSGVNASISTSGANAPISTNGANAPIFTGGVNAPISTGGEFASIFTSGEFASIFTSGTTAYIQTRSTFRLSNGTYTTTLSHAPTADRNPILPDASGTLALTSDITGGTLAGSFTTLTASATTSLLLGTAGSAVGNIGFRNATSGTTTLAPATGALGTGTVTLPLSGTLAISSGAQTFTGTQTFGAIDATSIGATTRGTVAGTTANFSGASTLTGTVTLAATSGLQLKLGTYSSGASEGGGPFSSGFQAADANESFFTLNRSNSFNSIMGGGVNGDAFRRVIYYADGAIAAGPGTATRDVWLHRSAVNTWTISSDGASGAGNLAIRGTLAVTGATTLGTGTAIKNIRHGVSGAMVLGVVTVTDTGCTANTRYFFTQFTQGTVTEPSAYWASTRTASTSFVITSSQLTETGTVHWTAIEP